MANRRLRALVASLAMACGWIEAAHACATVQTSDPGRALITGQWRDIGRFKGPTVRALAPRAPYFHNGFAADLHAVVDFYNDRFGIRFTDPERDDLVAFLSTL